MNTRWQKIEFALIAVCAMALVGCSPKYIVSVAPTSGQTVKYYNGKQFVISSLPGSAVAISPPTSSLQKFGEVAILVANKSQDSFEFDTESIAVETGAGQFVHVYSYAELMEDELERQKWAAVGAAFAAASNSMSAANAGTSTTYGNYSGNTYGTYGGTPYSAYTYGSGVTTTYDPAKAQAAQALANQQNNTNIQNMQQANRANETRLQSILKRTTIEPGQSYGGQVRFDLPKIVSDMSEKVLVDVKAGEESHLFVVAISKAK